MQIIHTFTISTGLGGFLTSTMSHFIHRSVTPVCNLRVYGCYEFGSDTTWKTWKRSPKEVEQLRIWPVNKTMVSCQFLRIFLNKYVYDMLKLIPFISYISAVSLVCLRCDKRTCSRSGSLPWSFGLPNKSPKNQRRKKKKATCWGNLRGFERLGV